MIRTFTNIALSMTFAALFSISVFAQVPVAAQAQPGRVYVVNPLLFADEKAGITKYVAGLTKLTGEFTKEQNELSGLASRIQTLANDLKAAKDSPETRTKADEYDRLQREFKFKQDDAKARYDKREREVMGPIRQEIGIALQEFSKKNGYWMLLDASKIDEVGGFLTVDPAADVTKAFMLFFNSRPATTTPPK